MKNKKTLILIIVLIVLIAGAAAGYNFLVDKQGAGDAAGSPESGQSASSIEPVEAVDFYVYDGDGKKVYLSDFTGKPVLINFWATWCGPCKMEFPVLEDAYVKYGDDVVFMMINQTDGQRDTVESVKTFVEENDLNFPVYFDSDLNASYTYGINSIPITFYINEKGLITNLHIGAISESGLTEMLEK